MKTKQQIKRDMKYGSVYKSSEFRGYVKDGLIIDYDGHGYFHDGENETEVSVFNEYGTFRQKESKKYPYVCWYGR